MQVPVYNQSQGLEVRKAGLSDVDEMADVHVRSWRETYAGLLENHVIDKFNVDNRKKSGPHFFKKTLIRRDPMLQLIQVKSLGLLHSKKKPPH